MIQRGARLVFPSPTFNAGSSLEVGDLTTQGYICFGTEELQLYN